MGDGPKIIINLGPPAPLDQPHGRDRHSDRSNDLPQAPKSPRENGNNLFNRQWNNSSASNLRNSLLSMLSGGETHSFSRTQTGDNTPPNQQNNLNNTTNTASTVSSNTPPHTEQSSAPNSPNTLAQTANPGTAVNSTLADIETVVNQTLGDLINSAKDHQSLREFRNQPPEFWDDVQRMSDLQIAEKYVDGKFEPRATSRYGELIDRFNRQGGQLTSFLSSLPPEEREVFQARYMLSQMTGADELFVGKGVVIDKSGQFVVREFLTNNGKKIDVPLNTLLGFLGGEFSETAANPLFANGQLLLNSKTAALLSLSLTLYQNINATLSLADGLSEAFTQALTGRTNENGGMRFLENNLEGAKANADRRTGETLIAAALINGALVTVERNDKYGNSATDRWKGGEAVLGNVFAAGAAGAMFGAVLGCIVPLAENNVGTALGFAASVVVGTSERGLRYLSANLLISDVITSGVQTFLSVATIAVPALAKSESDRLGRQFTNNRRLAYLTA